MPVFKYNRKRRNPDEVEAVSQFRGHLSAPYIAWSIGTRQEASMEGGKSSVSLYLMSDILVFADAFKHTWTKKNLRENLG